MKVVFAFDEARSLIGNKTKGNAGLLYHLLHALQYLPEDSGSFAVFTDTITRITNFAPVPYLDPSQRVVKSGLALFPPFHLLDTIDIYARHDFPKSLKEAENPGFFFCYGRPLRGALLSAQGSPDNFTPERIIELAKDKLLGG